jgi:hypothetical protein
MLPADCIRLIVDRMPIYIWSRCRFVSRRWARVCAQIAHSKYIVQAVEASKEWKQRSMRLYVHDRKIPMKYDRLEQLSLIFNYSALCDVNCIKQLSTLSRLNDLYIYCQGIEDSWEFARFQRLTRLCLVGGILSSGMFSAPMPNLKTLKIKNLNSRGRWNMEDIVDKLPNLNNLNFNMNYQNLDRLSGITCLSKLSIHTLRAASHIPTTVRKLSLIYAYNLDEDPINLQQLQRLTICSNNENIYRHIRYGNLQELRIKSFLEHGEVLNCLTWVKMKKLTIADTFEITTLYYISYISSIEHLCIHEIDRQDDETDVVEALLFFIRKMPLRILEIRDKAHDKEIMVQLRKMPCLQRVRFIEGWFSLH